MGVTLAVDRPGWAADAPARLELSVTDEARCLKILRDALKSDEFWPSMHAAEALALAGHGAEVRAALGPRLAAETDDRRRCGLARELVRAGDVSRVDVLLEVLAKDDPYGHVHAAESLYKVGRVGDGRLLRAAMGRKDFPTLQIMAAAALARCGNPAALPLVRRKLADEDMNIGRIAGWVLARLGNRSDVGPLRKALERAKDPVARCFLEHALAALGDAEGRKALVRNLSSKEPAAQTYAAVFAGEIGMTSTAGRLATLLDAPEEDVRIRAAQSLLTLARPQRPEPEAVFSVDVYPATDEHPRITEGSIVELHDGSLLYAVSEFSQGTGDAATARIVARSSGDDGRTWGPKRVLQENTGKLNVMSVTLRRLPHGDGPQRPLGMFYLVKNSLSDLKVYLRISLDEAKTFGKPILVTGDSGYHVMNNDRVTVLSTGRIIAPVAWTPDIRNRNHFVSFCYLSDDGGTSWRRGRGEVDMPRRGAMEPEVVELGDGRLVMILRNQLGYIAASHSGDGGATWSEPAPWNVRAPESPATLRRIPSTGDLLLVWNKHYKPGAGHGGPRTPLSAAISGDGGRRWTNVRDIESRADRTYAYTSLVFVGSRAVLSYYVRDEKTGRISSRFRSIPVSWFYRATAGEFRAAVFEADITIPLGHACMGGGVADAREIVDPLFAKGLVLLGSGKPIVVVALDWCQCNNDSYDRWRDVLAEAAGTSRERVMLATVHQHDAPICDLTAQKLLDQQGLKGYNCDPVFHEKAVQRTAAALKRSLGSARRVTHFGTGQAKVDRVASNRRVIDPEGRIRWNRGSSRGDLHGAPEGEIDPWLKTLSLWDGDRPVAAWSCYAVHPMSYYGQGGVSADFPGIARARRQKDDPAVFQMYFTGCSGDTTAGKYNTGKPENRPVLADRLYRAMVAAWKTTQRRPLGPVGFRVAKLRLGTREGGDFTPEAMARILADPEASRWERISAALGMSWRRRVEAGQPVDVPCLDLGGGAAQFLIMPAETFVGYQLIAQRLRPDSFVVVAGFGDGAPGYIPTDQCWKDGYDDPYCWVPPMTGKPMTRAMAEALGAAK